MTTTTSSVSIDRIDFPESRSGAIREMNVERPVPGARSNGPTFEISGWVLGNSGAATDLEILSEGQPIRRIPICRRRLRVARRYPDLPHAEMSGFLGIVSTLGLPAELKLELVVVLEGGGRVPIAVLRGQRVPVRTGFEPTLQPLMVTTLGRMASTWVMSLLAAHPQIVALRKYPYECNTAKYWAQVLANLAEPTMQPGNVERIHVDRWWVGSNPFFQPDLVREPRPGVGLYCDRLAEVCQRNIDSWYSELAFHQVKENVRYFAEKTNPNRVPPLMCELYPGAKEIFLVRDFRDWICSILAFDEKRGFHGFGRFQNESTIDYVRRHGRHAFDLRAHWRARSRTAHLVRYEDLVDDPEAALRTLFEYLHVDATPACVSEALREARTESETYRHHRTSASARRSIGRWRNDLTPELREIVEELFREVLVDFGYEAPETDPVEPDVEVAGASGYRLQEGTG